jgi:hypothetical protein
MDVFSLHYIRVQIGGPNVGPLAQTSSYEMQNIWLNRK